MKALCLQYAVNLPQLIAYLLVCMVSWWCVDGFIAGRCTAFNRTLVDDPSRTGVDNDARRALLEELSVLKHGKAIGQIERLFYIYAIMLNQFTLLSAWIIMKAFFGWIEKPGLTEALRDDERMNVKVYYSYIYGNALSLLVSVALAHVGFMIWATLEKHAF